MKDQHWLFSFFFITHDGAMEFNLYFVCFQEATAPDKAHQIIIADSAGVGKKYRKVAYIINPASIEIFNKATVEKLCRHAVAQFLRKSPVDNFLAQIFPLDLLGPVWGGPVIPLASKVTTPVDSPLRPSRDRSTTGVRGEIPPSTPRHSASLG